MFYVFFVVFCECVGFVIKWFVGKGDVYIELGKEVQKE